jgi:hypothetical protein
VELPQLIEHRIELALATRVQNIKLKAKAQRLQGRYRPCAVSSARYARGMDGIRSGSSSPRGGHLVTTSAMPLDSCRSCCGAEPFRLVPENCRASDRLEMSPFYRERKDDLAAATSYSGLTKPSRAGWFASVQAAS